MQSSVENKQQLVHTLLKRGSSANGKPGCAKVPLVVAADEKDYKMAAILLQHGADSSSIVSERNQEFIAKGEVTLCFCLFLVKEGKH